MSYVASLIAQVLPSSGGQWVAFAAQGVVNLGLAYFAWRGQQEKKKTAVAEARKQKIGRMEVTEENLWTLINNLMERQVAQDARILQLESDLRAVRDEKHAFRNEANALQMKLNEAEIRMRKCTCGACKP